MGDDILKKNSKILIGIAVVVAVIIAVVCIVIGVRGCNNDKATGGNVETQTQLETESITEEQTYETLTAQKESESETESQTETQIETQIETQRVTQAPTQKETQTQPQLTDEQKKAKTVVDSIIKDSMSDLEKVIAIHNWICVNCGESDTIGASTVTGLLDSKIGTAVGYAKTFDVMAKLAGQGSECVEGVFTDLDGSKRNHMWNKVEIDGKWYNIDVANDDSYASIGFFYLYFLKSDKQYAEVYATKTTGTHSCPEAYDAVKANKLAVARGENTNCMVATTAEEVKACADTMMSKNMEKFNIIYISDSLTSDNRWKAWNEVADNLLRPVMNIAMFAPKWGSLVYVITPMTKAEFDAIYVARTPDEVKAYAKQQYEAGLASYKIRFEPADGNVNAYANYGGGYGASYSTKKYSGGKLVTVTFKK